MTYIIITTINTKHVDHYEIVSGPHMAATMIYSIWLFVYILPYKNKRWTKLEIQKPVLWCCSTFLKLVMLHFWITLHHNVFLLCCHSPYILYHHIHDYINCGRIRTKLSVKVILLCKICPTKGNIPLNVKSDLRWTDVLILTWFNSKWSHTKSCCKKAYKSSWEAAVEGWKKDISVFLYI